jgi:predicted nuclease of restriction endonuclease-like (RecB) superfamily
MNKYKSIYFLINSITEDPTCLDNIMIESNNKQRKISKKVIENIKKFLITE